MVHISIYYWAYKTGPEIIPPIPVTLPEINAFLALLIATNMRSAGDQASVGETVTLAGIVQNGVSLGAVATATRAA